jgi:hypothetical protein
MRSLLVASLLFAFSLPLFGQTDRGTITGTVTDPAGAVIAGAMIQAKNLATGAVYPAASSGTGNYTVAQLPAGNYELTVTAMGFKQFVRSGLTVEVAGILRIDAAMEVGAATESVTVTEAATLLNTESTALSHNVRTSTLNDLPVLDLSGAGSTFTASYFGNAGGGLGNIRNPLSGVQLLPGTNFQTDNVLRINGMPSSSQSINIEGQDASNGFMRQLTQMTQSSTDAIQEVAIQTSNFAAEYGRAGGGYFNYTMKSGANQFHGSAYDYFVNEALNAGLPFTDAGFTNPAKSGQHVRNPIRQNDYGFTLGGPVWLPKIYHGHDKTFFFFSLEQFRQSNFTSNTIASVPTAAYRAGDFSAALLPFIPCGGPDPLGQPVCINEIFDPNTRTIVNGSPVETPFPGNKIPANRFDPTALSIQNLFPLPNVPSVSGLNNYLAPGYSNFRHTTVPSLKIDHNINAKMKLAVYYSATHTESPQTNGFPQVWNSVIPQDILSQTARVNFDDTLTPTLLLHLGAGLLHTSFPQQTQTYDQAANNLFPQGAPFPANYFPYTNGLFSFLSGGFSPGIGNNFYETPAQYDVKPTFTASTTWVKQNHTFKFGAEAVFEGLPTVGESGAQGLLGFGQQQTANPWQQGQPFATTASSGFGYASFLLGNLGSIGTTAPAHTRIGRHSYALYVQDNWKVTRKLTLELGLRWDYEILWKEQYGRMQSAGFNVPNPTIGGRIGAAEYEATCHCHFSYAYPYSIGPHLGAAYQITPKTVFRAGGAISYGAGSDNAQLNLIFQDRVGVNPPGYAFAAGQLKYGDPYGVGNVYGNPVLAWPDSFLNTSYFPPPTSSGLVIPSSPFVSIAPNAGRLPRIFQWSLGVQRELTRDLVVEASYVGNRGAWWVAPVISGFPNYNALTPQFLQSRYGLNVANPADHALLNLPITSTSVQQRFPGLAVTTLANGTPVVNSVYPGFPATQNLNQALRPFPQWNGIPPFLGPPMGRTWYDSLQIKGTKRFSHGLSAQVAYTWAKSLTLGTNANTSYITPQDPLINDVFNLYQNKQLSGFDLPQILTISFSYVTPKLQAGNSTGMKVLSWVLRDWTYSGLLRYQSGSLLPSPGSTNQLLSDLARGPSNNPAIFGGGVTFWNRVSGQPLFLVGPNSKFDPTTQLVLNPKAWVDAPLGQFGVSAGYYSNFRWQRQPSESMGFGRLFRMGSEGKYSLQLRAEFSNIFNRLFYSTPSIGSATNPASPTGHSNAYGSTTGLLSSGFGYVNWFNGAGAQPRSGKIVVRFQF